MDLGEVSRTQKFGQAKNLYQPPIMFKERSDVLKSISYLVTFCSLWTS